MGSPKPGAVLFLHFEFGPHELLAIVMYREK